MAEPAKEIKRDDRRSRRNNSAVARKRTFEGGGDGHPYQIDVVESSTK